MSLSMIPRLKVFALTLCIFIPRLMMTKKLEYQWIQDDNFFDCIVGVSANNQPIGIGVLMTPRAVITSANPYTDVYTFTTKKYSFSGYKIRLHYINGGWKNSKTITPQNIRGNQGDRRGQQWVPMGFSDKSMIFDFATISVNAYDKAGLEPTAKRKPYSIKFKRSRNFDLSKADNTLWKFVGFGFKDKAHINDSLALVVITGLETAIVDCDEWIPRRWGHYICFDNIYNYEGVQSGTPLFYGQNLSGIGAFELTKDNRSILIFSNLMSQYNNGVTYAHN